MRLEETPPSNPHVVSPAPAPQEGRSLWLWSLVVGGLAVVVGLLLARLLGFGPVDDAYITLRYSANWGRGGGLVYNPGEAVEGFSTFFLVALQATLVRVGMDPIMAMKLLGWGSLWALAGTTYAFLAIHLLPRRTVVAGALTLFLTANPMVVAWASSGMEPCLYGTLVLWCLMTAVGHRGPHRPLLAGFLLVLTAMTRLETLALVPVFALIVLLRDRSWKAVAAFLGIFVGLFGAYFFLRAQHFGYLFPNTFYAKVDYGNGELWWRGALYVWDFVKSVPLLFLFALGAVPLLFRGPLWLRGTFLLFSAQLAIVVYVGGDHFALFRFLVPAFIPLGILSLVPHFRGEMASVPEETPVGAPSEADPPYSWLWKRVVPPGLGLPGLQRALPVLLALLILGVSSFQAGKVHRRGLGIPNRAERIQEESQTQFQRFQFEASLAREWSEIGLALAGIAPPDASLCVITIGAIGYYSELHIRDPYGLIDPAIGQQERPLGEGYTGHEKYDVDYILAQSPELVLLVNSLTDNPVPVRGLQTAVWGEFNREMLARPELEERYRYETVQVGDRYLNLYVRRDLQLRR